MTWTILVLVLGIALFMFGGMMLKSDAKKSSNGIIMAKKAIKLVSVLLIAGSVCRLYVPYYLTSVNPAILQQMADGMQEQMNKEKNKINPLQACFGAPLLQKGVLFYQELW